LVLWILVINNTDAFCAKVIEVRAAEDMLVVTHEKDRAWIPGDRVCISRRGSELACGDVRSVTETTALVKITTQRERVSKKVLQDNRKGSFIELVFGKDPVKKGDEAEYAGETEQPLDESATDIIVQGLVNLNRFSEPAERRPTAINKDDLSIELDTRLPDDDDDRALHHGNLSNLSAGLSFIYPTFHYQQALHENFAFGIQPIFVSATAGNGTVKGLGSYLTFNYYGIEPFHGEWLQLGVGVFGLNANVNGTESKYYSPALQATAGWRWYWDTGLNFGFAVGAQYLIKSQPDNQSIDFGGLLPVVALDFGFSF